MRNVQRRIEKSIETLKKNFNLERKKYMYERKIYVYTCMHLFIQIIIILN